MTIDLLLLSFNLYPISFNLLLWTRNIPYKSFHVGSLTADVIIPQILQISRYQLFQQNNFELEDFEANSRPVVKTCLNNETFLISGRVLNLSDIPPKNDRQCNTATGQVTKIIELFSNERVYIDKDFIEIGEELSIAIIAPIWEVVGNRKIILDGAAGKPHYPNKVNRSIFGGSCTILPGKAGLPGGRGGSFYGIGRTFINGQNLVIRANGGNGGDGQSGSDGPDGLDGRTYNIEEGLDGLEDPRYRVDYKFGKFDPPGTTTTYFVVEGPNGTAGVKGGNGGVAGPGGEKGHIEIISLISKSFIIFSAEDGAEGVAGAGGKGGRGGLNARTVRFSVQNIQSWSYFSPTEERENGAAPDGEDGKPGESLLGHRFLYKDKVNFDLIRAVNDFKFYSRWYLSNNNDTEFQDFYNILEDDAIIKNSYNTLGFLQELYYLEVLYFHLRNKNHLLTSYWYLKERMENYSKNKINKEQIEFIENLNKFEQYSLQRISRLLGRKDEEQSAINLNLKLNVVYSSPEKIANGQFVRQLFKDIYESFFMTTNFLLRENQEKYEIRKENLEEKINWLVIQTTFVDDKQEIFKELESAFAERNSLNCLHITNLGLEFVNIVSTITYLSDAFELHKIPEQIQKIYEQTQRSYKNYINRRVAIISAHEAYVEEKKKLVKNDEEAKMLKTLTHPLADLIQNLVFADWIKEDPLKMEWRILLEVEKNLDDQLFNATNYLTLEVIKHLKVESKLAQALGDSYERFENGHVGKILRNIILEVQHLEYENNSNMRRDTLLEEMFPIVNDLRIEMGITGDIITTTEKYLFGRKKLIRRVLRNLNYLIVSWKESNDPCAIQLYPAIYYLKKMKASIHHLTGDVDLNEKLELLDFYRGYNNLVDNFREFILIYKQNSFPYGSEYFSPLEQVILILKEKNAKENNGGFKRLPKFNESSLNEKVDAIVLLHTKMIYLMNIENFRNFQTADFHSLNLSLENSTFPSFYVWKNEEYNNEISDFLSGKEIILTSVAETNGLNAVKFGKIGIALKSKNETVQKEVEKILENFNVTLTHLGNSHYRCNDDVYVINSDICFFNFKYKDSNYFEVEPKHLQYFLSPYATWILKLKPDKKNADLDYEYFSVCEKFKGLVDIHLTGKAIFLNEDNVKCENNLNEFYRKEGDLLEPRLIRDLNMVI